MNIKPFGQYIKEDYNPLFMDSPEAMRGTDLGDATYNDVLDYSDDEPLEDETADLSNSAIADQLMQGFTSGIEPVRWVLDCSVDSDELSHEELAEIASKVSTNIIDGKLRNGGWWSIEK